jgi:signal peptidase I
MMLKWFASRSVRQTWDMCKHVRKLLDAQRDILSPQAVEGLESALQEARKAIESKAGDEALKKEMSNLETAANKWLRPYPHAGIRENVEVLLVALAVAMGIRTFFLQPFKIPTGSMQPTLFGIMPSPGPYATNDPGLKIPGTMARFFDYWVRGESYFDITAPEDGELERVGPPTKAIFFNISQQYVFNGKTYSVAFPVDDLFRRAGYHIDPYGKVYESPQFKAGESIVRLKVTGGDHLFVDRLSYNFRQPKRGEIIVFETRGIEGMTPDQQDQFYIKRLVALGGEKVQIGRDRHLTIDGKRLDKSTPHFENVYSFDPGQPPRESQFSGHVYNEQLAPRFAEAPDGTVTVRQEHYMVMGDNTLNSADSRMWGDFSRTNVIGRYFVVYWPFSPRWGWNAR